MNNKAPENVVKNLKITEIQISRQFTQKKNSEGTTVALKPGKTKAYITVKSVNNGKTIRIRVPSKTVEELL